MEQDDIPLFPITGSEVGTIREAGVLILRLPFLSHAMQGLDQATMDRTYAMTPNQARSLVQQILSRLAILESSPPTSPEGSRH